MTHPAYQAWDRADEPLEVTEARIHDGAREPAEQRARAEFYHRELEHLFPWTKPAFGQRMMEVGSGLGYMLEEAYLRYAPLQIIGLDVAQSMIDKARRRLERDEVPTEHIAFVHYDGLEIPLPDDSVDYIFSVASLQHVPKPYVYNLLLELKRVLAPEGHCNLHLLSVANWPAHHQAVGIAEELARQLHGKDDHWHHFYAFDELVYLLADVMELKQIHLVDGSVSLWASFSKTGPTFRVRDLSRETHLQVQGRLAVQRDEFARLTPERQAEVLRREGRRLLELAQIFSRRQANDVVVRSSQRWAWADRLREWIAERVEGGEQTRR